MKRKQRPFLTESEYQAARGLVEVRPDTLADLGVDKKDELPWVDPKRVPGVVDMKIEVADGNTSLSFKDYARFQSSGELIEFLTNPASKYSPDSLDRLVFGNKYVVAWNELNDRVREFANPVQKAAKEAAEAAREAKERTDRGEKRDNINLWIALIAALTSAISLVLSIIK